MWDLPDSQLAVMPFHGTQYKRGALLYCVLISRLIVMWETLIPNCRDGRLSEPIPLGKTINP